MTRSLLFPRKLSMNSIRLYVLSTCQSIISRYIRCMRCIFFVHPQAALDPLEVDQSILIILFSIPSNDIWTKYNRPIRNFCIIKHSTFFDACNWSVSSEEKPEHKQMHVAFRFFLEKTVDYSIISIIEAIQGALNWNANQNIREVSILHQ